MTALDIKNFVTTYPSHLSNRSPIWIGAVSFEERCSGSLEYLKNNYIRLSKTILLDYQTRLVPDKFGESKRTLFRNKLLQLGEQLANGNVIKLAIEPYIYDDFLNLLKSEIFNNKNASVPIIIDVTCLTKVHTLAVSTLIAADKERNQWIIAYSRPFNYPSLAEWRADFGGWRDVLISPLDISGTISNQQEARGIIMPGHEGHRLVVALAELEPSAALIILANTPGRPDFKLVTQRKNIQARRYLKKIGICKNEITVDISESHSVWKLVQQEIEIAKITDAPIYLYPYGPKSFIVAATIAAAQQYLERAWYIYPIPTSYDPEYTEGCREVLWLSIP